MNKPLTLRLLTKNILEAPELKVGAIMSDLQVLEKKQQEVNQSQLSHIEKNYHLIADCKLHGTFQFSILARFAFIANILLKSLVSIGVIQQNRFHEFFETISTIPKMLINDLETLDFDDFLSNEFAEPYRRAELSIS